jgi:hypothetical protein
MNIKDDIESLKYKLNQLILVEENLCASKVIRLSEELDKLIAEYYKSMNDE